MLKNSPYRQLTIKIKELASLLDQNQLSASEAETILKELLAEFKRVENCELEIDQNELIAAFFPSLKLS